MFRPTGDVDAIQGNGTSVNQESAGHRAQQGGFPRTIGSNDDDERAFFEDEIDTLDCAHLIGSAWIENFCCIAHFKHGIS